MLNLLIMLNILKIFYNTSAYDCCIIFLHYEKGMILLKQQTAKNICYDNDLKLEAYSLSGTVQPFPNHIHDYYVAGIVEKGGRLLYCRNKEYLLWRGDALLLSPYDNHGCKQKSNEAFVYKAINIPKDVMNRYVREFDLGCENFCFSENVVSNSEIYNCINLLHNLVMLGGEKFEKEETLLIFISMLFKQYGSKNDNLSRYGEEIEKACRLMQAEYERHIALDELCEITMLSKSTLLRAFTKLKGITPYRYLQSVRVDKAKKLLEQGVSPSETAQRTGFADQSHFTRYFNNFIGVSPSQYKQIFDV